MLVLYLRPNKHCSISDQRDRVCGQPVFQEFIEDSKHFDRLWEAIACAKSSGSILYMPYTCGLQRSVRFLKILSSTQVRFAAHSKSLSMENLPRLLEKAQQPLSEKQLAALEKNQKRRAPSLTDENRKLAHQASRERARLYYAPLMSKIHRWRRAGWTLQEISDQLNSEGHLTQAGKPFHTTQIIRLLERYNEDAKLATPSESQTMASATPSTS